MRTAIVKAIRGLITMCLIGASISTYAQTSVLKSECSLSSSEIKRPTFVVASVLTKTYSVFPAPPQNSILKFENAICFEDEAAARAAGYKLGQK